LNQLENALLGKFKQEVSHSLKLENNGFILQPLADLYETRGEYFSVLLGENGDPRFAKKMKASMGSFLIKRF